MTLEEIYIDRRKQSWKERSFEMLQSVEALTKQCSMCLLGRKVCSEHNSVFDAHVFSNKKPSKFVVVGQNPGFNECIQGEPFVGQSGENFNKEISKYGINRDLFYISNIVKCKTPDNRAPSPNEIERCESILRLEIAIIRPKLIITLGLVSFKIVCPGIEYKTSLGKITKSKFGIPVFAIYHPSPLNFQDISRKKLFEKQIKLLCKIVKSV